MAWIPFIDISEAQGRVDFDHMHSAGVGHLIVRGHNGTRRDHRVDEYIPAARAAGIVVVAVYGFINPKSALTAAQQGEALAKICLQYEVATQMLDVEWYTGEPGRGAVLKGPFLGSWLRQMSDAAADITQTRGIIYTGHAFWDNPATGPAVGGFGDHDLILADYPGYRASGDPLPRGVAPADWWSQAFRYKAHGPTVPQGWNGWDGWQFSAGYNAQGPVYGCGSNDLDLNFASAEAVNRWASRSSQPVPVTPPEIPITVPTTPTTPVLQEDDDMPRIGPLFIQATGEDGNPPGTVYLCDGRLMTVRRLRGTGPETGQVPDEYADAVYQLGLIGVDTSAPPTPAGRVRAYGVIIG